MRRNLPRIPYETRTNRYARRQQEHREFLDMTDRVARETGLPTDEVIKYASKLPGDPIALRGIPAIGRGVGGAIHETKPGHGLK